MDKFLVRTVSAIGFAGVIIAAIWLGPLYAGIVFFLAGAFSLHEFYALCKKENYKPALIPGLLIHLGIFAWVFKGSFELTGFAKYLTAAFILLVFASLLRELFGKQERPMANAALTIFGNLYISIPFALLVFFYEFAGHGMHAGLLFSVFLLIWTNDTGAYIVGSAFGKHKLFPSVSPGKTWEGTIGGFVFVGLASWLLPFVFPYLTFGFLFPMGIIAAIGATTGDLIESRWKRSLGVKDSGRFLPGHGGFLDRFDALLIASPLVFAYCLLFS